MLTIHKASAGSGKTYKLAQQYIKLLLGVKDKTTGQYTLNADDTAAGRQRMPGRHRHILAITFTNKATDEMKTRIIKDLNGICHPVTKNEINFARQIADELHCTLDELSEAARRALSELLLDYGNFNVSTIDSFFQSVLRNFAREIDRQGDYEIEIDSTYAISAAISAMLDRFSLNPDDPTVSPVKTWLDDYMDFETRNGRQYNIFTQSGKTLEKLVDFVEDLFDERFNEFSDDIMHWLEDPAKISEFKKKLTEVLNAYTKRAEAIVKALESNMVPQPSSTFNKVLNIAAAGDIAGPEDFSATYINVIDVEDKSFESFFPKKDNKGKEAAAKFPAEDQKKFIDFLTDAYKHAGEYALLKTIRDNVNSMELLRLILGYLRDLCRDSNIMLLADTNALLHRIIGTEEFPFIYERLGVQLENFLIDEFQDTSKMQWQNLCPLVGASLADKNDDLIIGDVKQAIYRFRNSDSSMLAHTVAEEDFPGKNIILGDKPGENTNWRSAPDMVRFNNALFPVLSEALGVEGYEGVVQGIASKNDHLKGYVHFFPFKGTPRGRQKESAEDAKPNPLLVKAQKELADLGITPEFAPGTSDGDKAQYTVMLQQMLRQHKAKYKWNQITVLVNTNKDAKDVVDFLLLNNIPVLSDEGLLLRSSMAVRTAIALMTLIEKSTKADSPTPVDIPEGAPLADVRIMMCRFEYFLHETEGDIDAALKLALDPEVKATDASGKALSSQALIDDIVEQNPATLSALLEIILAKRISSKLLKDEAAYIAAFTDLVAEYTQHFGNSLHAFLRYWNTKSKKAAVSSPPESESVRVMTIHKSKGLEFPCVHIPSASWSTDGKEEDIWVKAPELELIPHELFPTAVRVTTSKNLRHSMSPIAKDAAENFKLRRADILNKTYVAYTRPVYELCVYYTPSENIGKILAEAFSAEGPAALATPSEIEGEYIIGAPTSFPPPKKPGEEKKKDEAPKAEEIKPAEEEIKHLNIGELTPNYVFGTENIFHKVLCIDDADDEEGDAGENDNGQKPLPRGLVEAADRGNAMHYAMSQLKRSTDDAALSKAFVKTSRIYKLDPATRAAYHDELAAAIANPDIAEAIEHWFVEPRLIRNEVPVMLAEPKTITNKETGVAEIMGSKRIDRLMFYPNGSIEVLDYKFTTAPDKENFAQVAEYMQLLQEAYPEAEVRGALWYVDNAEIYPVEIRPTH